MRFHVVSLPHTNTTKQFSTCAYTEKVRKFCKMMHDRGHSVTLYAGEYNEAPCEEHVPCINEDMRKIAVGNKHYTEASFDWNLPHWVAFNSNVIEAMDKRIKPKDFICLIAGLAQKPIADVFPEYMSVEFGIGYGGSFSKYKVFESYAWMHTCYGAQTGQPHACDGNAYHEVIPNYIDINDFPYGKDKKDYYMFLGRFVDRKGYKIAMEACKIVGADLKLAGPVTEEMKIHYGRYIGELGPKERGKFLSEARALFVPTQYIEPFGTVAIEAMACGTPVITSDWGAFTETVINGVNGYRCRVLQDYIDAMKAVKKLSPYKIRKYAVETYGLKSIGLRYELYFNRLMTLWDKGWYQLREAA